MTASLHGSPRIYATTYKHEWHEAWCARTRVWDVRTGRVRALRGLLAAGPPAILHGAGGFRTGYVDLIAAAIDARRGAPVLIADATWEPGSRALDRLRRQPRPIGHDAPPRPRRSLRAVIAALDHPSIHYVVLSRDEERTFAETWGVDPGRVHFVPFCATTFDHAPQPGGEGVIATGNSLRDYRALVTAAGRLAAPVTIATSLTLGSAALRSGNLEVGFFSAAEHDARLAGAAVVVVPLAAGTPRSAGQQSYLNAMGHGKPVIVTDAPGVRDYVENERTGLIVPNEPAALTTAIERVLRDADLARALGDAARRSVLERYTVRHYVDRLLALADRLA